MGQGGLHVVPGKDFNMAGQNLLDDILTTPGTRTVVNSGETSKAEQPSSGRMELEPPLIPTESSNTLESLSDDLTSSANVELDS